MASTQGKWDDLPDSALLRQKQVLQVYPVSGVTLWRRVKAGTFPQPHRLENGRVTAWRWGDVREWLHAQVQEKAA
jgi:prophage regulatory protein